MQKSNDCGYCCVYTQKQNAAYNFDKSRQPVFCVCALQVHQDRTHAANSEEGSLAIDMPWLLFNTKTRGVSTFCI